MEERADGIRLEHITKRFGKKTVLRDVSLAVPQGSIFGLLGPSGCGKTTAVRIMAGLLRADEGRACILGQPQPRRELAARIGYMTQSPALYPTLTAGENLRFFGSLYGLSRDELQQRVDYVAGLTALDGELKKCVSAYSGGMKQRLSLAITLLPRPDVLLLDEPTVGIDPILRHSIWQELYKLAAAGVTILVTTHVMDEADKCHQLAMLRDGVLLDSGAPAEIVARCGGGTIEDAFIRLGSKGGDDDAR